MLEVVVIGLVAIAIFLAVAGSGKDKPQRRNGRRSGSHKRRPDLAKTVRSPPPIPRSRELSGKCHVIDGDTIIIKRKKIRLAGIDAPELNQAFGQKSKWAMVNICKGQVVTAKLNGETSYDRLVGTCYLPDGRDIGAELIKQGLAVDWACFSGGKYRNLEPAGIRRILRRYPFDR